MLYNSGPQLLQLGGPAGRWGRMKPGYMSSKPVHLHTHPAQLARAKGWRAHAHTTQLVEVSLIV